MPARARFPPPTISGSRTQRPHRRLLRARRERPRGSCAAEQRDELAALHVGHGPSFCTTSLDRTVCTQERYGWNREAQQTRGLEIDDERKAGWLLDWDITRLRSLQNLIDERRHLTKSTA